MLEKNKWSYRRPGKLGDACTAFVGRAATVAIQPPLSICLLEFLLQPEGKV